MNRLNLFPLVHDRLRIAVSDDQGGLLVSLQGDIDSQDPSKVLDPFFDNVHAGAVAQRLSPVTIDFRGLHFLNSSGIKALAKWAIKLTLVKPDQRYHLRLLPNKASTWQAASLPTLALLVPGSITLV